MTIRGYEVEVQKLSLELGGGFVAFAPDLQGCIADGRSRVEALHHLEDAIECWLQVTRMLGRRIPNTCDS